MDDYLSFSDSHFEVFFSRLNRYADQKCGGDTPAWTHIPAEERAKLVDAYAVWNAAYVKTFVPHNKVETKAKNEAKKTGKALIRSFVNRFLREDWAAVKDTDRIYLEIPNKDKVLTPHPAPAEKPVVDAEPSGRGKHTVTAISPQTRNKKKPALAQGVAFAHKVRRPDEPVLSAEDMPSAFQASTSKDFQWPQEFYGRVADYACAYESGNGRRGPWSDTVSLIIT